MIGKHKAFDKKLHAVHDPKSRDIVKAYYLKAYNIILEDGKSRYDVDLISPCGIRTKIMRSGNRIASEKRVKMKAAAA